MTGMGTLFQAPGRWLGERPWLWQRPLLITVVLALSVALAGRLSLRQAAVVVALPMLVMGGLVLSRRPQLGPLSLIFIGLLVGIGSNNFNPTVISLSGLTIFWLLYLVASRQFGEVGQMRPLWPLLLLIGSGLLSLLVGQLPWFPLPPAPLSAQLAAVGVFVLSAAAFLMVAHLFGEEKWLRWMVWLFIGLGSIYLVARVSPRPIRRLGAFYPWGSTSCLYWTWIVALLFSQALLNRSLRPAVRGLLFLLLAMALYAALVQTFDWKSGWIPPLVAMAVILALRSWRLAIIMALIGLLVTPVLLSGLIAGDEYSYSTRVDAWVILWNIIEVNPITGVGPANYSRYTPLFPIRGYYVNFNSHNQYVDLVAQTGILGLICYLWFFWEIFKVAWWLRRRALSPFARAYVEGALGGWAAMVVAGFLGDWILPYVYNVGLVGMRSSVLGWLFLGGLLALDRMTAHQEQTTSPVEDARTPWRAALATPQGARKFGG